MQMEKLVILVLLAIPTIALIFFTRLALRSYYNYTASRKQRRSFDRTKTRHGMVFNTKTGKMEADQSFILPF